MIDTYGLPWEFEFIAPIGSYYIVDFGQTQHGNPLLRYRDSIGETYAWSAQRVAENVKSGKWCITQIIEEYPPNITEVLDLI